MGITNRMSKLFIVSLLLILSVNAINYQKRQFRVLAAEDDAPNMKVLSKTQDAYLQNSQKVLASQVPFSVEQLSAVNGVQRMEETAQDDKNALEVLRRRGRRGRRGRGRRGRGRRGRGRRGRGGKSKGGKSKGGKSKGGKSKGSSPPQKKDTKPKINPWTGQPNDKVKSCLDALKLVPTTDALCKLCWKCCKKRRLTIKVSREKTGGWFWHAARNKNCQWWAWKNIFSMKRMPAGIYDRTVSA